MHPGLINPAVVGYICAMGLALAYLVQRHELVHRLSVLATLAAWAVHTVALIVRAVELGAPPLGSLLDAISVAVWVIVLVEVMIEQRLGQRAHLRSAGLLLARGLDHLCRHPGRAGGGRLARTARGLFRHRRLRRPRAHAGRGPIPAGAARLLMALFVAGVSHKNAPVALREQLAVEEDKLRELLGDIQRDGVLPEVVVLATCNRVEVYGVADAPGEARAMAFRHLCRYRGLDFSAVESVLYTHLDAEAVRHAFPLAASLAPMMTREPQILGQAKDPFALAPP